MIVHEQLLSRSQSGWRVHFVDRVKFRFENDRVNLSKEKSTVKVIEKNKGLLTGRFVRERSQNEIATSIGSLDISGNVETP